MTKTKHITPFKYYKIIDSNSSIFGKSLILFKPKCFKNAVSVTHVTGLPGVSLLPAGLIHFNSNKESKVPLKTGLPLIFSISALVTG